MDIKTIKSKYTMLKKNILKLFTIFLFGTLFTTSCNDDLNEVTSLETDRIFAPVKFTSSNTKTLVTFTWVPVNDAVSYTLQVSLDSLDYSNLVLDTTLTEHTYTQEFGGATQYYARLMANSSDIEKKSKYNTLSFKTPSENLFSGFGTSNNTGSIYSAYMTDFNTLTIKWSPGANVTHLILTSQDESTRDSISLTSEEIASGIKTVSSLSNSKWKVQIYNRTIPRGTTHGTIEGDILLNVGDDLQATLNSAIDGQTIVLAGGGVFNVGSAAFKLDKSIKLRGLSTDNRPVVCLKEGSATATSTLLGFAEGSTIQSVKFENIDFTGYVDNNTSSTKIGYLFNNNTLTNVTKLTFTNCNIHNFGNTPMRIQGNKNQVIDSLSFNGCVIYDIGFSSTYAIVNSNSSDFINSIEIKNSTIYNFKGSLVLRTGQPLKSVTISNCTINQGMQDASSARYLMDFSNATFNGDGINIKNCILGQTGNVLGANGLRLGVEVKPNISGTYYTSDYTDDPIPPGATSSSIKSTMTSYSGVSTSLWVDPANGTFKLADLNFAGAKKAGDPRWW
ncbi:MAG: DUF5123 domain-containing protein [Paludibacteraceae bacterium]